MYDQNRHNRSWYVGLSIGMHIPHIHVSSRFNKYLCARYVCPRRILTNTTSSMRALRLIPRQQPKEGLIAWILLLRTLSQSFTSNIEWRHMCVFFGLCKVQVQRKHYRREYLWQLRPGIMFIHVYKRTIIHLNDKIFNTIFVLKLSFNLLIQTPISLLLHVWSTNLRIFRLSSFFDTTSY